MEINHQNWGIGAAWEDDVEIGSTPQPGFQSPPDLWHFCQKLLGGRSKVSTIFYPARHLDFVAGVGISSFKIKQPIRDAQMTYKNLSYLLSVREKKPSKPGNSAWKRDFFRARWVSENVTRTQLKGCCWPPKRLGIVRWVTATRITW